MPILLPFVSTYIDDVLIHSADDEMHAKHLNEVFMRLRKAGLTVVRQEMCDWYTTGHISGSSFYRIWCNSRQGVIQSCGRVANSPKCKRSTPVPGAGIVLSPIHSKLCGCGCATP